MNIHTAKTMGDVMKLVLLVSSRAEGKRFVMNYLESAPDLTEPEVIANLKLGLSRHFDGAAFAAEYQRYVSYFC